MAKNLKLNIKNTQIAQAVNLNTLKGKIGKKKATEKEESAQEGLPKGDPISADVQEKEKHDKKSAAPVVEEKKEDAPKIKARSRSAFADGNIPHMENYPQVSEDLPPQPRDEEFEEIFPTEKEILRNESPRNLPLEEVEEFQTASPEQLRAKLFQDKEVEEKEAKVVGDIPVPQAPPRPVPSLLLRNRTAPPRENLPAREKLGPTGKHIKDLIPPPKPPVRSRQDFRSEEGGQNREGSSDNQRSDGYRPRYERHDGPRHDGPRHDGPRHDGPRHDGQRHEGPRHDGPRHEGQRHDGPRYDGQNRGGYQQGYRQDQRPRNPAYGQPGSHPGQPGSQGSPQGQGAPTGFRERREGGPPFRERREGGPPFRDSRGPYRPPGAHSGPPGGPGRGSFPFRNDALSREAAPGRGGAPLPPQGKTEDKKIAKPPGKFKEFKDLKPTKKTDSTKQFDARDRQGLRAGEEDSNWRGKKRKGHRPIQEELTIRPTQLKVRLPIAIKDLAEKMKLKASQLVGKLFLQGVIVTLNDLLEDETTVQLLGHEFGCELTIDTSEEERVRITDKTIREEISESNPDNLILRPPVVAFMGHVDHGKTSLIDAIRSSNRAAGEAGAITQHIGAFRCSTQVGDIAILDTPGHEAFSAMRARGAEVTDIVVLVVAGDEGLRQQTIEAIQHAKAAKVTIVVAINKSDKPNFNPENVYRQLAEQDLLPESWGGQTITVNCSAVTKAGIKELLEMLAVQAEVLELKADPTARARGTVIESELHKGMGSVATVLVQNGTLKLGDALVFGQHFGKVKTMRDEHGNLLQEAGPSTPVSITGLSGLPEAGQEFIVVKSEKEARDISEIRTQGIKQTSLMKKKLSMDHLLEQASESGKKIMNVILRADVQGSLEALKVALMKIESNKAELNIIFTGVGEISESDVQLAAASKAVILGFHSQVEGHAESLLKEHGVQVRLHDIIYHAIDDIKALMAGLLDKIPQETEKGKALVKAVFKSSQHGLIAGCQVIEGTIARNNIIRVVRDKAVVFKGNISSLKRVKEDVREVSKGLECGILLANYNDIKENDILEAFEITYLTQEL